MKQKSKNFIVPLVVYPFDVMVSLNQSDESLKKDLLKYYKSIEDVDYHFESYGEDNHLGTCIMLPNGQLLIKTKMYPVTNEDYAILVHEIFHAVCLVFHRIGIILTKETDEAWAYMIEYLTKEIYNKI